MLSAAAEHLAAGLPLVVEGLNSDNVEDDYFALGVLYFFVVQGLYYLVVDY